MKLFSIKGGKHEALPEQTAAALQTAPGTEIRYDPNLIAHFTDHHHQLAGLLGSLKDAASKARYNDAQRILRDFRVLLYQHLLEENVRLYTYLGACLRDDTEGRELMGDMRKEMGEIGRTMTRFIKAYTDTGISAGNVESFQEHLASIASALTERVGREERSLYTLYLPPSQIGASVPG